VEGRIWKWVEVEQVGWIRRDGGWCERVPVVFWGGGLNQRELLNLEGSLEVQTLHEVIQSSRIWIGGAIQNA
jgi:hypothetical protein